MILLHHAKTIFATIKNVGGPSKIFLIIKEADALSVEIPRDLFCVYKSIDPLIFLNALRCQ